MIHGYCIGLHSSRRSPPHPPHDHGCNQPAKEGHILSLAQTSPLSAGPCPCDPRPPTCHACTPSCHRAIHPPQCSHTNLFKTQIGSLSLLSLPSFFLASRTKITIFYVAHEAPNDQLFLPPAGLIPGVPWFCAPAQRVSAVPPLRLLYAPPPPKLFCPILTVLSTSPQSG